MARILITGSADGLGSLAARQLVRRGHTVILHARNAERAEAAREACPGAETVLIGDLSSISSTKALAAEANAYASTSASASAQAEGPASTRPIDCIIHNAGLYKEPKPRNTNTTTQIPAITTVNTLAPYILTCLMHRPQRLVYVTSGYHHNGDASLRDITWERRLQNGNSPGAAKFNDLQAYADSKLHDVLLAKAFARRWNSRYGTRSDALDPGWVPTKMGGASAPGSLDAAVETYVMLAEETDAATAAAAAATGKLFGPRRKQTRPKAEADDIGVQDKLIEILEGITGVKVPE